MKQAVRLTVGLVCLSLLLLAGASAQDQYNEGTVDRVVLIRILPGHGNAFWADLKANITPVWDAEKSAGLIEGYHIFLNQTKANPEDWDLGYVLTYKNMAALDGIEDRVEPLIKKIWATRDTAAKAEVDRESLREILGSQLIRRLDLK